MLSLLEPGDSTVADRDFDIEDDLPPSLKLNIPQFLQENTRVELEDKVFVNDEPISWIFLGHFSCRNLFGDSFIKIYFVHYFV